MAVPLTTSSVLVEVTVPWKFPWAESYFNIYACEKSINIRGLQAWISSHQDRLSTYSILRGNKRIVDRNNLDIRVVDTGSLIAIVSLELLSFSHLRNNDDKDR